MTSHSKGGEGVQAGVMMCDVGVREAKVVRRHARYTGKCWYSRMNSSMELHTSFHPFSQP